MSAATGSTTKEKPFAGIVVVFTGVPRKNVEKYRREIARLGGEVKDSIDDSTSFLVVKRVGSEKYLKARTRGVPCVQSRWLNDCLHRKVLLAPDAYLARPLEGCVVTATQIDLEERETLEKLVQENGGAYSRDLKIVTSSTTELATTHLVALARSGEKYLRASIEKHIRIVSAGWVEACVAEGAWVDERQYPVLSKPAVQPKSLAAISAVKQVGGGATPMVHGETLGSEAAARKAAGTVAQRTGIRCEDLPPIDDFPPSQIFQGHVFYIHGYPSQICDFIIQLILKGGGVRYPLLLPGVTTAVFDDGLVDDSFVRAIKRMPFDIAQFTAEQLVGWYRNDPSEAAGANTMAEVMASSGSVSATVQPAIAVVEPEQAAEAYEYDDEEEQASLGIGTELQIFTKLLSSNAPKPVQQAARTQRSRLWGASQATKLSGESTTKRWSGLSRKQIEGGAMGQTPNKKTRLHQQLDPEPESQQITFNVL